MAKVKIQGHASGTGILTVTAPNTSTDRTITLPDATGTLLNSDGSGASLTALNATNLGSGTVPTARLGSGTASSSTFLRGDSTYATVSTPITALNNATANELVTVGSTTTELDAESGLTYDGSTLAVTGDLSASGDIYAAVGSEANPSFAFTGDTNTGLWHPDADTIAFSTAGNHRMRILADGTLCVGETSVMSSLGTSLFSRANKANGYSAIFLNDGNDANRWGILIACGMDTPSSTVNYPIKFRDGDGNDIDNISYDSTGVSYNGQNTAKAWVNFNGNGTIAIRNSHNVSSITDQAVGDYYYTMSNAITDTNPTIINGFSERDCHCATDYAANTTTQIHLEACNVNGTKGDKGYVVSLCFR